SVRTRTGVTGGHRGVSSAAPKDTDLFSREEEAERELNDDLESWLSPSSDDRHSSRDNGRCFHELECTGSRIPLPLSLPRQELTGSSDLSSCRVRVSASGPSCRTVHLGSRAASAAGAESELAIGSALVAHPAAAPVICCAGEI